MNLATQMKNDTWSRTLVSSQALVTTGFNTFAGAQLAINIFLSAGLMHFFEMLNSLQIMCFQTMMNLDYPANAAFFADTIISILNVDVLSPELITDAYFNFTSDEQLMEILNDPNSTYSDQNILIPSIQEMGFESYNSILNM
jgi:hypothetical protein